jgi:prepilin-type N-terminal cleavage/methylation domain-containing protein
MKRTQKTEGFTLIELMIVVAIIAIIAAIAIPSLLNARKAAIASMRTLSTVSEQYRNRFDTFPVTTPLATLETTGYVDSNLGAGSKSGYDFVFVGTASTWTCTAAPTIPTSTGDRFFFIDESGVIRWDGTAAATVASPALN